MFTVVLIVYFSVQEQKLQLNEHTLLSLYEQTRSTFQEIYGYLS